MCLLRGRAAPTAWVEILAFSECIRTSNRKAIHDYAHSCIDVVWQHVVSFSRPLLTMALVQGDALGGGFETALSCDVIVAEKAQRWVYPKCYSIFFREWARIVF